jgi:hypothetical protein
VAGIIGFYLLQPRAQRDHGHGNFRIEVYSSLDIVRIGLGDNAIQGGGDGESAFVLVHVVRSIRVLAQTAKTEGPDMQPAVGQLRVEDIQQTRGYLPFGGVDEILEGTEFGYKASKGHPGIVFGVQVQGPGALDIDAGRPLAPGRKLAIAVIFIFIFHRSGPVA